MRALSPSGDTSLLVVFAGEIGVVGVGSGTGVRHSVLDNVAINKLIERLLIISGNVPETGRTYMEQETPAPVQAPP